MRGPHSRRRKRNSINEVPTPVTLDLELILAWLKQDLPRGNSSPGCGSREVDLAATSTVQDYGCYFVSIGPIVNQAEVVEASGLVGDGKSDLVGGVGEAFYVAGSWIELTIMIF